MTCRIQQTGTPAPKFRSELYTGETSTSYDSLVWIMYENNLYGRVLAGTVALSIPDNIGVRFVPRRQRFTTTRLLRTKLVHPEDTIYLINICPSADDFEKLLQRTANVYWFDNRYSRVPDVFEKYAEYFNPQSGELYIDGWRSDTYDLGVRLWDFLFNQDASEIGVRYPVPPYLKAVDAWFSNQYTVGQKAFVRGLEGCVTMPRRAFDFYTALASTVECLADDAPLEERKERMRWDAYMQVCNMGYIIVEYIARLTRWMLPFAKPIVLPHGQTAVMVNAREVDIDILRNFCRRHYPRIDYCGWFYQENKVYPEYHVALVATHPEDYTPGGEGATRSYEELKLVADLYGGWANHFQAIFTTPSMQYVYIDPLDS
jgi:hypothetical protein